MIPATQTIQVKDRASWKVAPEALWKEINRPGSTDLPKIPPLTEERRSSLHFTLAPDEIPQGELADRLNNVHMKLFWIKRDVLQTRGLWDQSSSTGYVSGQPDSSDQKVGIRWFTDGKSDGPDGPSYGTFSGYSLKYLQGTDLEFYGKITDAIVAAGISDEEIIELRQAYCTPERFPQGHFRALHAKICFPVYRELYNQGYGRREIAG